MPYIKRKILYFKIKFQEIPERKNNKKINFAEILYYNNNKLNPLSIERLS